MIEVYLGNELGNLTESDCRAIKAKLDGKSYYSFIVSWSSYAGNCQLIVKTEYPNAEKEAVRTLFLHVLASEFATASRRGKILELYTMAHTENPETIVMFDKENRCYFYFADAARVRYILNNDYLAVAHTKQGWPIASFDRRYMDEAIFKFREKGIALRIYRMKDI